MATKEALRKSALAALQTWPKDPLRPTAQLRDVLTARFNNLSATPSSSSSSSSSSEAGELKAINALLADKYKSKYPLELNPPYPDAPGGIMYPTSNPEYYKTLIKDLEEVPTRTTSQSWLIRLKGLFRFS